MIWFLPLSRRLPCMKCWEQTAWIALLKHVIMLQKKGLVVIGDIKRGDIASTAEAYSNGHIGEIDAFGVKHKIFNEDFITVNPISWLGFYRAIYG